MTTSQRQQIEDGEFREEQLSTALAVVAPQVAMTIFGTNDAGAIKDRVIAAAQYLGEVVERADLAMNIQGRKYVRIEGWQFAGSELGITPETEWTRPIGADSGGRHFGWEACVILRSADGRVVGRGEAMVGRDEKSWSNRDEYAIRSMAQTRAAGKAFRQTLGFIMPIAGYAGTPAEEMGAEEREERQPAQRRPAPRPQQRSAKSAEQQEWERTHPDGNDTIAVQQQPWNADTRDAPPPPPQRPATTAPTTAPDPGTVKTVTGLMKWANGRYGMDEADVLAACGVEDKRGIQNLGLTASIARVDAAAKRAAEAETANDNTTSDPDDLPLG